MKAVFIDADHRKVKDIEINFSGRCGLGEFYEKIGNGCDMVQAVPWDDENDLVCDEEAILRGNTKSGFNYGGASLAGYGMIFGNAIVVGCGLEEWADTTETAEKVAEKITFFTL